VAQDKKNKFKVGDLVYRTGHSSIVISTGDLAIVTQFDPKENVGSFSKVEVHVQKTSRFVWTFDRYWRLVE
jgi:high-affinity nickel permease